MVLTDNEMQAIIEIQKTVEGDILWLPVGRFSASFKVKITSAHDHKLFVTGSYTPVREKLTYNVVDEAIKHSIYRLDLGQDHRNPDGQLTGELHKHRWTNPHKESFAYVPADITAPATDPLTVWLQFCDEFNLMHDGQMHPPATQLVI